MAQKPVGSRILRESNRVMRTANDYAKEAFNAGVGRVLAINPVEKRLSVDLDERVVGYAAFDLQQLTLTYAITIHKSQGSEFPVVVVPADGEQPLRDVAAQSNERSHCPGVSAAVDLACAPA